MPLQHFFFLHSSPRDLSSWKIHWVCGELVFCGHCGAKIEGEYSFCPECGKSLNMPQAPLPFPPQNPPAYQQPMAPPLPGPLGSVLRLNPAESVLKLYRVNNIGDPRQRDSENPTQYTGVLAITDQRLVFIVESGVFQKKYSMGEVIELDAIRLVDVSGIMVKSLSVHHLRNNLTYRSGFEDITEVDPVSLRRTINISLYQAQQVINDALARRRGAPVPT